MLFRSPEEVRPLIDDLNLLLGRVKQAFDAQKSFVANAAHELRSPLAALKIQVQGLQRAPDDETRKVAITRLASGIERATHLVDQLLVLARQEASANVGQTLQSFDLAQVGLMALTDVLPHAQARQIDLGVHHAAPTMIHGNPDALRILVRNLLDNGIKYMTPGGTVDLNVTTSGSLALLTVEDTGPGIPEADQAKVLDRFYRIPGSGTEGSGLGLAIVKAIADVHGATVALDQSPRLGGLRVTIAFKTT